MDGTHDHGFPSLASLSHAAQGPAKVCKLENMARLGRLERPTSGSGEHFPDISTGNEYTRVSDPVLCVSGDQYIRSGHHRIFSRPVEWQGSSYNGVVGGACRTPAIAQGMANRPISLVAVHRRTPGELQSRMEQAAAMRKSGSTGALVVQSLSQTSDSE